jgi:hypothetical protein
LAYARIRKIDSDLVRANRQRDVLEAVFDKFKSTPITKMPDVVAKMLSLCHTTLSAEEIIEMGTWAVTNIPEIISYTLPDTKVNADWIYAGGNSPKAVANYKVSSINGRVEDVGSRYPNGLELYDMSGNVSEWCFDGNDNRKRIRGGSFMSSCVGISVSYSDVASVDNRSKTIGLRLVLNE